MSKAFELTTQPFISRILVSGKLTAQPLVSRILVSGKELSMVILYFIFLYLSTPPEKNSAVILITNCSIDKADR